MIEKLDLEQIKHMEDNRQYIANMRPVFNRRALFSDTTGDYLIPPEPSANEDVIVRFRTARNNVDRVLLVYRGEQFIMEKTETEKHFDYYTAKIHLESEKVTYHFEVQSGRLHGYYDTRGLVQDVNEYYDFVILPGFSTPQWSKGAVMYQIYVDRFCNGDPTNDVLTDEYSYINDHVQRVEDWNRNPANMDVRNFYGGDLQGVLDKMDYLQELGVDVIYFNPLFVSPSNHKYDIQDYDYIDPHFGKIVDDSGDLLPHGQNENRQASRYINRVTNRANLEAGNQLFIRVVEEAHKRGIRIILDGVFNHCGSFNKWLDRERIYEGAEGYEKGAYVSADSPYRSYFQFHNENCWPYNNSYDGWWGHDTLPKLNYEDSQALFDYVMHVAKKWVSPPFNADGWRLDVAADLGHSQEYNHYFWQQFRKAVKEANPEALILAEHYGNTRDWLQGNEWDTVMNYDAFMEPVTWFLTGMEKHSDDYREDLLGNAESFWGAMKHHCASFSMPSWQVAMNELSNHDHSRFLTRTNRRVGRIENAGAYAAEQGINKAVFREAVVIQMTWLGAPTIYYGDEAGLCGFTDPDSRRSYPWGREDQGLIAFHKKIIHLRRENEELRYGSIKYVDSDYNFLAYGRFNKNGHCLILVNNNSCPIEREIFVWDLGTPKHGKMRALLWTDENGFSDGQEYEVVSGKIHVQLPKTCAVILKFVPAE